jgi:hypothetical protein
VNTYTTKHNSHLIVKKEKKDYKEAFRVTDLDMEYGKSNEK